MQERLSMKEKLAYGIGEIGQSAIFQTVSVFLLIFYTDVFGISPAVAGTLFLVARVWDAINDPIMGAIIDKTYTKRGKFRPYILFGALPLALFALLCFITPDLSATGKIVYAYVTYIGLGMLITVVNTPYGALTASMTQDIQERGSLSAIRMIFSMIGTMFAVSGVPVLVAIFGAGNQQQGYQQTMIILAVILFITLIICGLGTKERHTSPKSTETITPKRIFQMLKTNKPLQIICVVFVIIFGNVAIGSAVGMYLWKYNFGREELFPIYMMVGLIPQMVTLFFVPFLLKKGVEKKTLLMVGLIIAMLRGAVVYTGNIPIIMLGALLGGVGSGMSAGVLWGLVPDTIEYGEWKTGVRAEGIIYSIVGLFYKFGMALGGLVPGFVLQYTGYVANQPQTDMAHQGIITLVATIPIVLTGICILFVRQYKLDSKTYNTIISELSQRKETGATVER